MCLACRVYMNRVLILSPRVLQACFIHCSPECAAFAKRLPEKWSKPLYPDPEPLPPPVSVPPEVPLEADSKPVKLGRLAAKAAASKLGALPGRDLKP